MGFGVIFQLRDTSLVAFNKNCHILAFSLVFCLFLHDATSITVGQVVIQIKNQNSQNLCGLHSSADFIFFFSQKLRITFECGLNSSAGCFRVNTVIDFTNHLMSSRTDSCYGVSLFATDERDANCWIFAVVLLALLYYPESRN